MGTNMSTSADINDAIFSALQSADGNVVALSLANFVRSQMYHKFTRMPKRGIMHQVMPARELRPGHYWNRLGVPRSELDGQVASGEATDLYSWCLDGPLFYEIAERRLAREDFERRFTARLVSEWEWKSHAKLQRSLKRTYAKGDTVLTLDQQEERAYQIMGELVALI